MKKLSKLMVALVLIVAICASCMTVLAEAGDTQYVRATASVNVRSGAGINYDDIGTLEKGEKVLYLGKTSRDAKGNKWYKVQLYSEGTGWVSAQYAKLVTDVAGAEGVANGSVAVSGSYVKATGGKSNLRTGPGLGYDDIGTIQKGETANYLDRYSTDERGIVWYYVSFDGEKGWVSSRYTDLKSGSSTDADTDKYVRASASVNVRSGPGIDYDDIGTLEKNEQVAYLGKSSRDSGGMLWYKVKLYSQGTGWVSSKYSKIVSGGDNQAGVADSETITFGNYVKATGGKSNLRTGPGLDYDDIGTIQKGETATYLDKSSTDERGVVWYKVSFDGETGWLSARYTTLY